MSLISDSIQSVCRDYGFELKRIGNEWYAKCPFHNDGKRPNFRVNPDKNTWYCDVCGEGGGVVELIARKERRDKREVYRELAAKNIPPQPQQRVVATYDYYDALGNLRYQVCRMDPKSFRQRHPDGRGGWVWNMEGVERILYRLPELLKPTVKYVWIVEGEKDVETLRSLKQTATCNVGGAGKWVEAYSAVLNGKNVILCGDNDDPGRKHMQQVMESLEAHAGSIRLITVPAPFKDITDWRDGVRDTGKFTELLVTAIDAAPVMLRGGMLPVKTMAELEADYAQHVKDSKTGSVDLGRWIPSLKCVRPLVPGELVSVVGDTGTCKTYVLQHIAYCCNVPTLLFELELPDSLTFERFVAIARKRPARDVYEDYGSGRQAEYADLNHIFTCGKSRITPDEIEAIILKSELKMGVRPTLVLVDYIQLVKGTGQSRYEKVSSVAEQLKVVAKSTGTVVVMASQVGRDKDSPEIHLHDAKDSGSIENSSGVVIGIWRDENKPEVLNVKVIKNTKGRISQTIPCIIDTTCMRIVEQALISDEDVPTRTSKPPYPDADLL